MTEKIKELYAEFMSKRPKYAKVLIKLGMLNYQTIVGNDECIFRRTWHWWNPLVWLFMLLAISALLLTLIVAAPFVVISITYKCTVKLTSPKVVNCIAIDTKKK